ncbi:MAG: hypothetical protein KDD11_12075 [Acidobacteria bacterium]|nr:hypothetical protein [Acidobacteriota bacterium]
MLFDFRSRTLRREIRRWLAAEAADQTELAEQALGRALLALPPAPLPVDFAVRVLERAGLPVPARDVFSRRWVRLVITFAFVVIAGVAALLPGLVFQAGGAVTPEGIAATAHGAVNLLGRGLAGGVTMAHELVDLGDLALGVVTSPGFAALVASLTLLTLGALRLGTELIHDHGGRRHAEPI